MSELAKKAAPVIGEKPYCRFHPTKPIEMVCTARECHHRVLCIECQPEHERLAFNHKTLVCKLNDWYKEFNNLKGLFDPADNHSVLFLLDQITTSLTKQREQINESQNKMLETFQKALKEFMEFFSSLSDEMNSLLWKKQKLQDEAFEKVKKKLDQMSYKNCKKPIYDLMKAELGVNFQKGTLEEFYSKVYNGEYSNQIFDQYGGVKGLQTDLKSLRDEIEEGFRRFDPKKFEEVWHNELETLKVRIQDNFYKGIFQRVELDFFNPKIPKVRVVEEQPSVEVVEKLPKVICTTNITTSSSTLCASLSEDILLTASTSRIFKVWDASHNYRELNEIDQSNEEDDDIKIKSMCPLEFLNKETKQTNHFVLLGGDDECPHIEVWDYSANKFLTIFEKAHENGISCIKEVKREYSVKDDSCTYYIATAACDNMIKIWSLIISRTTQPEVDIKIKLYKETEAHSEFISCLVPLPKCNAAGGSFIISGSHDKSVNFWKWEDDPANGKELPGKIKKSDEEEIKMNGEIHAEDKYHFKMKCAHSDFVKAIALLYDREDASDLEFFATGGGDNMIKIWSLKDKKLLKAFTNNKRPINKMTYLSCGKIATSANEKQLKEYYVYIWDWRRAQMLAVLKDHKAMIQNVSKLCDGTLLTSDTKTIRIWKLEYDESSQTKKPQLPVNEITKQ